MRSWFSLVVWFVAALFLVNATAFAQSSSPNGLYCTSGLQPDGYIDFSAMPPAPKTAPGQPSPQVTATLPVHGVPGLAVTVTVPPLAPNTDSSGPVYSVNGGTLQLNATLSQDPSGSILILNFNQPVTGVGLNTQTTGRFAYTYTLQVGIPDPTDPLKPFATTASGYTMELGIPQTQSLQMVGLPGSPPTSFQTASVFFNGSEYYTLALSNIRVRSTSAPDPSKAVPTNGLQQWLRADTSTAFGSSTWKDQSGNGHDATPGTVAPTLTADGRNCQPAWSFSNNAYFNFDLPIAGWKQMTIFMIAKASTDGPAANLYSQNSAILWTENQNWGNTFLTPYQTHASARFGTTQVGNNLAYVRPAGGIGQDFTSTRAVHDNGTDSLYVNGMLVFSQAGKLSALGGVTGAGTIGEGINHTFFDGEISELLVYDRVLSNDEAAAVENYLSTKYGLH